MNIEYHVTRVADCKFIVQLRQTPVCHKNKMCIVQCSTISCNCLGGETTAV